MFGFHGRKYCPFCVGRPLVIGFFQPCWKTRGIQFGQPMTYSALFDAKLLGSLKLRLSLEHQHQGCKIALRISIMKFVLTHQYLSSFRHGHTF